MLEDTIKKYVVVGAISLAGSIGMYGCAPSLAERGENSLSSCCSKLECKAKGYDDCRADGKKIMNDQVFTVCECYNYAPPSSSSGSSGSSIDRGGDKDTKGGPSGHCERAKK
jgi:hypothetical protein